MGEAAISTGSIHTFQSRSGARKFPRVEFPAQIEIDGVLYPTKEWSVGGFSLDDAKLPGKKGDKYNGHLCFELPVGRFSTPVQFEVMRASENGYALGCQFYSLNSGHRKTLQSIVDTYLTGETISLESVTSYGVKAQLHEEEVKRMQQNWWRFAVVALVSLSLIVVAGLMVQARILSITSEHAAVSQPVLTQRSYNNGILRLGDYKPGQKVNKGELLFTVFTEEGTDLMAKNQFELSNINSEINYYQTLLRQSKEAVARYNTRLFNELKILTERKKLTEEELQTLENILSLYNTGVKKGSVDVISRELARVEILDIKRDLLQMDAQSEFIENQLDQILLGVPPREAQGDMKSPFEVQSKLSILIAKKDKVLEEIERQKNRGLAYAPCNCYIVAINASDGQVVHTGTSIFELSPVAKADRTARSILALMPLEGAELLKIGMPVEYRLASHDAKLQGTIEQIQFYSAANSEIFNDEGESLSGLPKTLPRLQQYTLVKITPNDENIDMMVNEPATVIATVGWKDVFKNWFNL
ncbi:HlyD family efflux transporter periplasmic adaptor subunit [Enterovibrio paralichthyis]|uniref:HlyD family efflux transporter periplasmic adaptor subunit n=1 Tax=Enterovibrio paralichthyis TaxID=2853805 RepID=UPI001C4446F1|nr:HlyD family efflux transporter periplasmic adaptor subunit [Enterovibrio paralichthyis]MBV7297305.1 HlyD family efflux transporter periplasmic adaptor subunit [Enterovibrio paralichthyis]